MFSWRACFVILAFTSVGVNSFLRQIYPTWNPKLTEGDVGEPLYLTPLLEAGEIEEAQQMASVTEIFDVQSYSGYFTVREEFNSNLFFWFFPSKVS